MSAHEIEAAIIRLTPQQLFGLLSWLEAYHTQTGPYGYEPEPEREQFDGGSDETEDGYAAAD